MSTIEIKKYETFDYDELSPEAQEQAYVNWIEGQTEWFWADEAIEAMKCFAVHFDASVKDYAVYGLCQQRNYVKFDMDEDYGKLEYIRLWKYLQNNGLVDKGILDGECPLTGVCYDETLLDEIRTFIKKPYNITFYDLIDKCFDKWLKCCSDDQEYQVSEECFKEYASDEKYLEDGTVFYS